MSLHETGMLWLRGPNIFEGYIDDPDRTAEVIQEGKIRTYDMGGSNTTLEMGEAIAAKL